MVAAQRARRKPARLLTASIKRSVRFWQTGENEARRMLRRGRQQRLLGMQHCNNNQQYRQMKKQTIRLLVLGAFLMGFTLVTNHFFETPQGIADFLKGLGCAFIIASLLVQRKLERKSIGS